MWAKLLRQASFRHKLERRTMHRLKFGKINPMTNLVTFGRWVLFCTKWLHLTLLSQPKTWKVFSQKLPKVFTRKFLHNIQAIFPEWSHRFCKWIPRNDPQRSKFFTCQFSLPSTMNIETIFQMTWVIPLPFWARSKYLVTYLCSPSVSQRRSMNRTRSRKRNRSLLSTDFK